MKYMLPLALVASLALCATAQATPGFQTKAEGPKEDLVLKSKDTPHLSVVFSHKAHQGVGCDTCHHLPRCVICHFNPKAEKAPNTSCSSAGCHPDMGRTNEENSRFMAFHKRDSVRSCFSCHSKSGKYEGCTPCHDDRQDAPSK